MGPKIGLNGVDNGFLTFNKVRIPRENLLNKTGDVTPDGRYVTPYKVYRNPSKLHMITKFENKFEIEYNEGSK